MKKTQLAIAILSGLAMLASGSVLASNRAGAVTITPNVGYYFFSHARHLDNNWMPNLSIAYNFSDAWGIEGTFGQTDTHDKVSGRGLRADLYLVNAVYHFTPHGVFEPYINAGVGALYLSRSVHNANTQGNINAGLGTQLFVDDSIAFRLEARDMYSLNGGRNDAMVNLGVSFLFGGNTVQPVPVVYHDFKAEHVNYKGEVSSK